jgi:hypothetical protein
MPMLGMVIGEDESGEHETRESGAVLAAIAR